MTLMVKRVLVLISVVVGLASAMWALSDAPRYQRVQSQESATLLGSQGAKRCQHTAGWVACGLVYWTPCVIENSVCYGCDTPASEEATECVDGEYTCGLIPPEDVDCGEMLIGRCHSGVCSLTGTTGGMCQGSQDHPQRKCSGF